jgi:hypothetical protein
MAKILIQNVTDAPVLLGDFYTSILPGARMHITRPAHSIPGLASLKAAVAAEEVAVGIIFEAHEIPCTDPLSLPAEPGHKSWEVRSTAHKTVDEL